MLIGNRCGQETGNLIYLEWPNYSNILMFGLSTTLYNPAIYLCNFCKKPSIIITGHIQNVQFNLKPYNPLGQTHANAYTMANCCG